MIHSLERYHFHLDAKDCARSLTRRRWSPDRYRAACSTFMWLDPRACIDHLAQSYHGSNTCTSTMSVQYWQQVVSWSLSCLTRISLAAVLA